MLMRSRPQPPADRYGLLSGAERGVVAGLTGVAVMTVGKRLELAISNRPNSFVPGRTLKTLPGQHPTDSDQSVPWNHAMYWGTGATVGAFHGRSQPSAPPPPPNGKVPQC